MLPAGGFLLAILAGWALPSRLLSEELQLPRSAVMTLRVLLRYVVPAGIVAATLGPLFG